MRVFAPAAAAAPVGETLKQRRGETEMEVGGRGGVEVEEGVMRVLLVDDSPVDRRVAQLLLSSDSCAGSFHGQQRRSRLRPRLVIS